MNSKWYWLIRQKYRNLKFQIKKAAFRLNERKESSERLSSFSRIVIRTLLVQVAINLVLVAVLYVGDKLLLSAMEIFAKTQTDPLIAALSESILVDIVIGGIGVAGVILGLYCSNMTSVYLTPLPRINYSQHLAEYHDGKINASQLGDVILKKNLRN